MTLHCATVKQNSTFAEATPGYRVVDPDGGCLAVYVPEFRQIWTNPSQSRNTVNKILTEEFIHAAQTSFRPSELLPLRNYLAGTTNHPRHDEFRDIVEAVFCAAHQLATRRSVSPHRLTLPASPYRELGQHILQLAGNLAAVRIESPASQGARRAALWAVVLALLDVVPLAEGTCPAILKEIENWQPERRWKDAADLLRMLLRRLAPAHPGTPSLQRPWTVVGPNESHYLLLRAVGVITDFIEAATERVVPAMPVLLAALTLDLERTTYLIYSCRASRKLEMGIEAWNFTRENVRVTANLLRPLLNRLRAPDPSARPCPALLFHMNCTEMLRRLLVRRPSPSPQLILHEALELFQAALQRLVLPAAERGFHCQACANVLQDRRFLEQAAGIARTGGREKARLIEAADRHVSWVNAGFPDFARSVLDIPRRIRVWRPKVVLRPKPAQPFRRITAFAFGGERHAVLAEFLPALGQIWISPDCPQRLLTWVRSHEITHYSQCALHPSQLVHFRSLLLDRPLDDPGVFHDLVEASYLVGFTIEAGFRPDPALFPPAPEDVRSLAERIVRTARKLARAAAADMTRDTAEAVACRALLMVLWHCAPARSGQGPAIVDLVGRVRPPPAWRAYDELWPKLHWGLQLLLQQAPHPSFILFSPMDPHRTVAEMLIFLSQALMPVPERREAIIMGLPVLLQAITFASLGSVPLIELCRRGNHRYVARIEALQSQASLEAAISHVIKTQTDLLQERRAQGHACVCAEFFVETLRATEPFRRSRSTVRWQRYLARMFTDFRSERFTVESLSCPLCRAHLSTPTVRGALESLDVTLAAGAGRLVGAARAYEQWLASGCLDLIRARWGLRGAIKPVICYDRL